MAKRRREFTAKWLDAIKPTAGATETYWDTGTRGLNIRYGARGVPSFSLVFRVAGSDKQQRRSLGLYWQGTGDRPPGHITLAEARTKAASIKEHAARGIDTPKPRRTRGVLLAPDGEDVASVRRVLERYGREYLVKRRTGHVIGQQLEKHLLPVIGGKAIGAVTPADMESILSAVYDAGKGFMSNWLYAHARKFFGWCETRRPRGAGLIESSPMAKILRPMEKEPSRDTVLSDAQLVEIWQAIETFDPARRDVIRLAMVLGCRIGEGRKMAWADLDLKRGEWNVPASATKNAVARIVYLSEFATNLITERDRVLDCPYVFSFNGKTPIADVSTYVCRLKDDRPGLGDIRLHDLRRSFATGLAKLKHDPLVIDRCLGHSTVLKGVAAVYQKFEFSEQRKAAFLAWSDHVESLVAPKKRKVSK
jgi:integrase